MCVAVTRRKSSMFSEKWKNEIITLPNLFSFFRILLIPVYLTVYLRANDTRQYLLAGGILAISCITDIADGLIARKFHMITNVGKILDPLADKLTQFALIISLSTRYKALYPVLVLFLIKELFQCGAFLFFAQKGKALSGALAAGKICTTVLFVSLIYLVSFPDIRGNRIFMVTLTDFVFLLYSFCSYFDAYFGKENSLTDFNR